MPRHREKMTLELTSEEALTACRRALPALGWEPYEEGHGRLLAAEDQARLCCHDSPSRVEIELASRGPDRTELTFKASAPGVGPIPGPSRLIRQVRALKAGIGRYAR